MKQSHLLKAYQSAVIALGAAVCLTSVAHLSTRSLDLRFLFLTLATLGIGSRITVGIPRVKGQISVSDTFIFLAILLFDKEAAVLLAAGEGLCSSIRFSKKPITILFNIAVMSTATFLAASTAKILLGPAVFSDITSSNYIAGLTVLACVQYAINSGFVAVGAALKTNQPLWLTWKEGFLWTSLTYFAGASTAGVVARLINEVGFYGILVTTPIVAVVYFTYCIYLKNIEASKAQAETAERHMAALRESEERFRSAFDHAAGMALVAPDGRWIKVNHSLSDILGYSESELLRIDFQAVTDQEDLPTILEQIELLRAGVIPKLQIEHRLLHKNGEMIWVLLSVTGIKDPQDAPANLVFQIQDITDRKRDQQRLAHDAVHDALTGLPNRVRFMDHLKQACARAKRRKHLPFAVLFLDFDRFKLINDSLGHMLGDQLLVGIADRLKASVRPFDTVARLGGDEFTILLEDLNSPEEAETIAERLLRNLALPFNLSGHEVFTSASIGIAQSTIGYEQPEDVLRDADTAMYRAKSLGKARYEVFDKSMRTNAVNLLRIETDLWRAIERNELYLEYQPIVSLETGRITGFEALLRWQHPLLGIIPPSNFIKVAEESGLIISIGSWTLQESCRQIRQWKESFPEYPEAFISVNLSAKQLMKPDLANQLRALSQTMNISPGSIKVEITESMVMNNVESTITVLKQLRDLGIETSIDDFGTGYSSLSYLPRFPISTLKVDRSFVGSMTGCKDNLEIVRTIIMLAQNLKMSVVAEGVETAAQVAALQEMGCEYGQGYFFAKSLPADKAAELLAEHSVYNILQLDRVIEYENTLIA